MEDAGIVELLWQREESGLEVAKEAHGAACIRLAQNLLGSREDAEECFADALLRLWNSVPPERPLRLRAYLLKLTRNAAIDRLRAETAEKRGGGETAALLDELSECVSGSIDAESEAMSRALGEAVGRFLATLPARQSRMFVLRYFHGEPVHSLAERFGMRANSVTVSLRRTREKLRAYLEQEGFML